MLRQSIGNRELCYVSQVTDVLEHPNADRLQIVKIDGWTCLCGKGELQKGDFGVFFEVDSKLPEVRPFSDSEFLVNKHYRIRAQKLRGVISDALFMPIASFEGTEFEGAVKAASEEYSLDPSSEGRFLTEALKVTYAVTEDNKRKSSGLDKYKSMAQRYPNLFKRQLFRWLMKRMWGKKLLFLFFGRKRDKKVGFPTHICPKTDEERVQNLGYLFTDPDRENKYWVVTEKIDGTSFTAAIERTKTGKIKSYICSRNVVFTAKKKDCWYDVNYYTQAEEKYHFIDMLTELVKLRGAQTAAIQCEIYGNGVQKRDYGLTGQSIAAFNLWFDGHRLPSAEAADIVAKYDIPWVPILGALKLPVTCDEMLEYATDTSRIDGGPREGVVLRSEDGQDSFKAVSNSYLVKYHG